VREGEESRKRRAEIPPARSHNCGALRRGRIRIAKLGARARALSRYLAGGKSAAITVRALRRRQGGDFRQRALPLAISRTRLNEGRRVGRIVITRALPRSDRALMDFRPSPGIVIAIPSRKSSSTTTRIDKQQPCVLMRMKPRPRYDGGRISRSLSRALIYRRELSIPRTSSFFRFPAGDGKGAREGGGPQRRFTIRAERLCAALV